MTDPAPEIPLPLPTNYVTDQVGHVRHHNKLSYAVNVSRASTPASLATFGVLPDNTGAQNADGFASAAVSGETDFWLPDGTYTVTKTQGQSLMSFVGKKGIRVRGSGAAVLNDTTTYTNQGAFTSMFLFDNCKDVEVSGIEYVGPTIPDPANNHGYWGAIYLRAISGTQNVKLDARMSNLRYGLQTGDYATASTGWCAGFDVKIRGTMIGYPVAAYLADHGTLDIDVEKVHRACYLAGCDDWQGTVRYKDNYIAPYMLLITDSLTGGTDAAAQADPVGSPTTSRGTSNLDIDMIDVGSTIQEPSTWIAGIALQRADPCVYRNIKVNVTATCTNTVSTQTLAFALTGGPDTVWSRYAGKNFNSGILFENIEISGVLDKSAVSVENGYAPIFIRARDETNQFTQAATVRGLKFDGLIIKVGSTPPANSQVMVPGATRPVVFKRFQQVGHPIVLQGSSQAAFVFDESQVGTIDTTSWPSQTPPEIVLGPGTIATGTSADTTVTVEGGTLRGAGPRHRMKQITANLSGSSVTLSGAIPAGAVDVRLQSRVVAAITGATGYSLGVPGDLTRYSNNDGTAVGVGTWPASAPSTAPVSTYGSATDLVITARTSAFTGGSIRLMISYWEYPPMTS